MRSLSRTAALIEEAGAADVECENYSNGAAARAHCFTCHDDLSEGTHSWIANHYFHISDFRISHERGCKLCSLIYRGLKAFRPTMEEENHQIYCIIDKESIVVIDFDAPQTNSCQWEIQIRPKRGKPSLFGIVGTALGLPRSFYSEECFRWIETCITDCESNHEHPLCRREAEASLPTRIIDLGTGNESLPRLFISNGRRGRYIALSHCWGKSQHFTTTTKNLAQRMMGFNLDELPKTFRDAIVVARRLGVLFLWIDSLCILQDDKDDWERESAVMAEVYANAYLTLAAASSSGDGVGFLQERPPCIRGTMVSSLSGSSQAEPDVVVSESIPHHIQAASGKRFAAVDSPLGTRAWAMQEDVLSRRIISFQEHEIVWKCHTRCLCECGYMNDEANMRDRKLFTFPMTEEEAYALWASIVTQYSERRLTVEDDKLPALSGLAFRFRNVTYAHENDYLAGLWRGDLIRSLLWYVRTTGDIPKSLPQQYRAPSWSWASVDGSIDRELDRKLLHDCKAIFRTSILDAQCVQLGRDPFGRVADGYVTLSGPILNVALKDLEFQKSPNQSGLPQLWGTFFPDAFLIEREAQFATGESILTATRCHRSSLDVATSSAVVSCILIVDHDLAPPRGDYTFLVLGLLDISHEKYERLGLWSVYDQIGSAREWVNSGQIQTVTIV